MNIGLEERKRGGMILIIGGAYQGKLAYAKNRYPDIVWTDGETCGEEELLECKGIFHFHKLTERMMRDGKDLKSLMELADRLAIKNPEIIIVTDEIGYGIVPVDAFERAYRENTGRVCTALAAKAEEVHRVICGIGTKIKG